MEESEVKNILKYLNYSFLEWKSEILSKKYWDYKIEIDLTSDNLSSCKIDFWNEIIINRWTTSNFSQNETLVVLECIDRLLEIGYKPSNIELEKSWQLWHKWKWFLDILVKDIDWKAFLMIECKTYGKEYENELKNMLLSDKSWEPKGQLFSYYTKDRSTKYLCLYTSKLVKNELKVENSIIFMDNDIFWSCDNDKEVFNAWNKQFENSWIFEEWIKPYKIEINWVLEKNLKELTKDSGWFIFNQFAEILRRNVVSDKNNAFNKIFNLFICKIKDEDDNFWKWDVKMKFQWEDNKSPIDVFLNLSDLYKKWMKDYLWIDIKDHSREETDKLLTSYTWRKEQLEKLKSIITELRLYKNNEFAFIEIFDEKSFNQNSKIVKEIVKLLEKYRIRYSKKQQFLWDFFEKLLNTWIKQEAWQFFTPIPVAKFICDSIPFEKIIKNKIEKEENNFLPYVIDYASWAWHFLTEAMERINKILKKMNENEVSWKIMTQNFNKYRENFAFADEYIYWIEKDYRLSKTSKVSCFLNWDWEANIFCTDWLNSFSSNEYRWILYNENKSIDNPIFDCIVANPPYSVKSFKNTIKWIKDNFELSNKLTDQSSEIECLFIERTKQLLKDWWFAWLVLPVSILNNGWIYEATRELILKYFDIKALVELWSETFMATWTNTVVLFLERKSDENYKKAKYFINNFFSDYKDFYIDWEENIISKYTKIVYNLSLDEYISKINDFSLLDNDYKKEFEKKKNEKDLKNYIIKIEKEKLLYFILTYNKKTITVKAPSKQDWKDFLWYEFSNRKGYEGIKYYENEDGSIKSLLYDELDLANNKKVNSYIFNNFLNNKIDNISEELSWIVEVRNLNELFDFERVNFDKTINTSKKKVLISKWELVKLWDYVETINGLWTWKKRPFKTVKVIRNTNFSKNWKLDLKNIAELEVEENQYKSRKLEYWDIIIEKSGWSNDQAVGRVVFFNLIDWEYSYSNFTTRIRVIKDNIKSKYLFLYLNNFYDSWQTFYFQSWLSWLKNLNLDLYLSIKIPLPPKEIQEKIVNNILEIEKKESDLKNEVENLEKNIENLIKNAWGEEVKIWDLCKKIINWWTPSKNILEYWNKKEVNWLTTPDINKNSIYINSTSQFLSKKWWEKVSIVPINSVILSCTATIWRVCINKIKLTTNQQLSAIICNEKVIPEFLAYYLRLQKDNLEKLANNPWVKHINLEMLRNFKIKIPNNQQEIVKKIEEIEEKLNNLRLDLESLKSEKQKVLDENL